MDEKNEENEKEQERVKPERMDHLEKGAEIGKARERKPEDKKENN